MPTFMGGHSGALSIAPVAKTAAGDVFVLDVSGYTTGTLQLTGTFVGTLVVEGSNDNAVWVAKALISQSNIGSAADVASVTAPGLWSFACGERYIRARCSAYTSGTLSVSASIERGPLPVPRSFFATLASLVLQAGTALIGAVGLNASPTVGTGTTNSRLAAIAGTNAAAVKTSAGKLFGYTVTNNTAAAKFVKLYNKASAPTVGTDVPVATIIVPANGTASYFNPIGKAFSLGIGVAVTGAIADADTTAVAANDVHGHLDFA